MSLSPHSISEFLLTSSERAARKNYQRYRTPRGQTICLARVPVELTFYSMPHRCASQEPGRGALAAARRAHVPCGRSVIAKRAPDRESWARLSCNKAWDRLDSLVFKQWAIHK